MAAVWSSRASYIAILPWNSKSIVSNCIEDAPRNNIPAQQSFRKLGWSFRRSCGTSLYSKESRNSSEILTYNLSNCLPGIISAVSVESTEGSKMGKHSNSRKVGRGSRIIGSGSAVPSKVITNEDLSSVVETSDEWISSRTGIRNRRVLSEEESLTGLAMAASRNALEMAGVDPLSIDLVIMCTSTEEDIFGSACVVQAGLGCKNAVAFDLTAACSGFVMGLVTATRFIRGGGFENVLVIGADSLSRYVDWYDRGTCILFGDGAGAVVVRAAADDEEDGLMGFDLKSDGEGNKHLTATVTTNGAATSENGASSLAFPSKASTNFIQMNGKEVYRFAVKAVPQVVSGALLEAGLDASGVNWLLLHQANQRILDAVADKMKIPSEKVISNLANYGNTSAASIPLALDEAVRAGKVQEGDVIATAGFGAGLSWGSAVFRWK